MRPIRRGDRGPAVAEVRAALSDLGHLDPRPGATGNRSVGDHASAHDGGHHTDSTSHQAASSEAASSEAVSSEAVYDDAVELAVRAFQQSRGLTADGRVDIETWQALQAARWRLGDRLLYRSLPEPLVGDDVVQLQERLLEMGFHLGRADGIFGPATEHALAQFQREVGLLPDGACGPATMHALRRLGRKVVGGKPLLLRESELLRRAGPALVGKRVVIDPGHGGGDAGVVVQDGQLVWTEADLAFDLALRLEGRLAAGGVQVHLTRGRENGYPDAQRARFANQLGADLFLSLHHDGHGNPHAQGVAAYHFGTGNGVTSTAAERLAGLVHRELVARTQLVDCGVHPKTWDVLRLTRMAAIRVEIGYLTSPLDRGRIIDPSFRDTAADAIIAGVQRMYLPSGGDFQTGQFDVSSLRAAVAATP